ncbi:MAG: adenylyltransferase/cytidyltransferase family protein [Planctomycetes bacterium]|nr:adenylyltransferase/cytidyltransferase family protein [Planctomycetota bacterium]
MRATLEKGKILWPRAELARVLARLRKKELVERVVLANGCFDLLHAGHVRCLEAAAAEGGIVVVALLSDATARKQKGAGRPVLPLRERAELVGALRCVDAVTSYGEATLERTLRILHPDVHAKGTDYTPASVPERDVDDELGIEIAICGDLKRRSSSELLKRIAHGTRPR